MKRIALIGLGFTPAESRAVRAIPRELKALVGPPTDNNTQLKVSTPDVERDTMPALISKIKRTSYQIKELAAKLKGNSLAQTLRNDSDFILKYIKYKEDDPENEQLRSPRRLIYDGYGDCDCFAVFLGGLLREQGIHYKLRIASYARTPQDWTHIYVIVPTNQKTKSTATRNDYVVLDPVTNGHDKEAAFAKTKDYDMSGLNGLQSLDGLRTLRGMPRLGSLGRLGACETGAAVENSKTAYIQTLRKFVPTSELEYMGLVPTEKYLQDNNIPYESKVDTETNTGYFSVPTANGVIDVQPVLTKEDLATFKQILAAPAAPAAAVEKPVAAAAQPSQTFWWTAILTVGGALLSKSPSSNSGLGKVPVKAKTKLRTVHI